MTEKSIPIPPFPKDDQINHQLSMPEDSHNPHAIESTAGRRQGRNSIPVPGYPLQDATDMDQVRELLSRQLLTPQLDDMHPILWTVATRKSDHVYALHQQIVRGREIILAENPGLHLIWYYDKIYIKPIPPYLFNHAFWNTHLYGDDQVTVELRQAALGFLRTYVWLIQSESDFELARGKLLIPQTSQFVDFLHFIDHFRHVEDSDVNPRYRQYGQLRLSRLNLWSRVYRGTMFYYKVDAHVALSGMAVVLAVDDGFDVTPNEVFAGVSTWFSVVCLVLITAVLVFFPLMQGMFLIRELVYVVCNWNKTGFKD